MIKYFDKRYKDEVLTDNTGFETCKQCKDCVFRNDGTIYSNNYQKGCCMIYEYPDVKPLGVIDNKTKCEFYDPE